MNKYVDTGITVAGLSPTELWLLCARVLQLLRAVQGEHTGLLHVGLVADCISMAGGWYWHVF